MARSVKSIEELRIPETYSVCYSEYLEDCKSFGIVLEHNKTKARICILSNDDDNKVFSISFRTVPTDDTGVPHIIEHSVLCGSRKFRAKDPFMEMNKSSLNTFLNAFSYNDKTVYPVASCNEKDFQNLIDVYMDAVLHPRIYESPMAFKQEGWHYEIDSVEDPITINGVVYNEMKGAFSSPEEIIIREAFQCMFPDNLYSKEYGGDPKAIPSLTYEDYIAFHKRYYHPSNSFIYLYGDMDIEEKLSWLDKSYLAEYDYLEVDSVIKEQKPVGIIDAKSYYPIGDEDSEKDASYIAAVMKLEKFDDNQLNVAMDLLCDVLFNAPGSPVKHALVDAGICKDSYCGVMRDMLQPVVMAMFKNTEADKMDEFKRIFKETLEKLVSEGINKKSMLAAVNRAEFVYREADSGWQPKGLIYGLNVLQTWLYDDKEAFNRLHQNELFPKLRELIDTDYYEKLIEKYLLNSESQVFFMLEPKKGLGAEENKELEEKLADYKAGLTDEELNQLILDNKALKEYQEAESTPEELATIPMLSRNDLSREVQPLVNELKVESGIECLCHNYNTNGIAYINFLFDLNEVDKELIPYLALLDKFMGSMDTKNYSYLELDNEININTGGISTSIITLNHKDRKNYYRPMFNIGMKVLYQNMDKAFSLVLEQINNTIFDSDKRILELINEMQSRMQESITTSGHVFAKARAESNLRSEAMFRELTDGLYFYEFITDLVKNFDEKKSLIIENMKKLCSMIFTQDNFIVDICCEGDGYSVFTKEFANVIADIKKLGRVDGTLASYEAKRCGVIFESSNKSEAFKLPGQVQYVALVGQFDASSSEEAGLFAVLRNILNTDYLYKNLRVLGGAYGGGCSFAEVSGMGYFTSYRDPKLLETIEVYKKTPEYIRSFNPSEDELTKYVIGTIGSLDMPLSPSAKGSRAFNAYIKNIDETYLKQRRERIIDANTERIKKLADKIEEIVNNFSVCVVGNDQKIMESADKFDSIKNIS